MALRNNLMNSDHSYGFTGEKENPMTLRRSNGRLSIEINDNLKILAELLNRLNFVNREINGALKSKTTNRCA